MSQPPESQPPESQPPESQPPESQPPEDQIYAGESVDPNPYQSASAPPQGFPPAQPQGDATGGLIPYKNVPALIGYYTGVASLIPCMGPPFGLIAIVLGIMGLFKKKSMPQAKGSAHAIVAIVLGLLSITVHAGLFIWLYLDSV